ncbi:MAG TPA: hypothetical protein VJ144_01650, partial [Candidatus Polarisedimenticolia bacterium]|nr:hypothetical protein [Candidatus Polarisedimenticolia bacterium]
TPTIDNLRKAAALATGFGLEESPPLVDMLKALRSLVDSLGAWRDYKAIVFMGDGIPENPAARYFDELAKFGNPDLLADAERSSLSLEVKNLAWAASAAGVVLHTVQTEGLVAGDAAALTANRRRSNTLETLALNTGGIASSSNEPLKGLREAEETSRAYYVIGYAPEGPPDGRYHSVQVRCRKSGARVRSRRGFMRLPASEAHARTVQAAYLLPELYPGLGIDFSAIPGPRDPSGRVVDLVIHLPANRILFLPEGGKLVAHLEAGLVALDDSPHETFRTAQKLRIVLDPRALQDGRPGIDFYSRVRLPATAESITAVVSDDAGGVVGGAHLSLAAAQDGPGDLLGLSIYSLADRTLWIELAASPHAGGSAERTAAYAFGPALKTSFAVGEALACGFLMPGAAGAVPPPLRVAILHGEQIVKSLSLPADQGRPGETVKVPLPVEDLPPGDYLLAVQETEGGRPRIRGAEAFRLQPGDPSGFAAAGTSSPP